MYSNKTTHQYIANSLKGSSGARLKRSTRWRDVNNNRDISVVTGSAVLNLKNKVLLIPPTKTACTEHVKRAAYRGLREVIRACIKPVV